MKYECADCKKVFLHPAKRADKDIMKDTGDERSVEYHVCPFCKSLNLLDHVEVEPAITSVKSVDLAEVDGLLKEGYVVHELYAKNAVLVKKEA